MSQNSLHYFILLIWISAALATSSQDAITAEDKQLRDDFINEKLEKMEDIVDDLEGEIYEFSIKSSDFIEVQIQIDIQRDGINEMKNIMKNPKSPALYPYIEALRIDFDDVDDEDRNLVRDLFFIDKLRQAQEAIELAELLLAKLIHLGDFSDIYELFWKQKQNIKELEKVIDNPDQIPKKSVLAQTMDQSKNKTDATKHVKSKEAFATKNTNQKEYYAFITTTGVPASLQLYTVDAKTQKFVTSLSLMDVKEKYSSNKEFIENFPKLFQENNYKAVIFSVFGIAIPGYSTNHLFCKSAKEALDAINVPYHFSSMTNWLISRILVHGNINLKVGEVFTYCAGDTQFFHILDYQFTENGYKRIEKKKIDAKIDDQKLRKEIFGSNNPIKILTTSLILPAEAKRLQKVMGRFPGFAVINPGDQEKDALTIAEMSKWVLDKKNNNFILPSFTINEFVINGKCGNKTFHSPLIEIDSPLPQKSENGGYSKASHASAYLAYHTALWDEENIAPLEIPRNLHRTKLDLYVDINNFATYKLTPFLLPEIVAMPKVLKKTIESKVPVITFFDNISVMFFYKDGEYKYVDGWNGIGGEELYISFADITPKFGTEALKDYEKHPSSLVYDLIKLMSMPADKIQMHPLWTFKIGKNAKNPVLVKYIASDGTRKSESPASLMALLLKEHLKVIEKETGEKSEKIAIWFKDDFDVEGYTLVEEGLTEACKLAKIECSFPYLEI